MTKLGNLDPQKTIYIGNLPENIKKEDINKLLSVFGEITNIVILPDPENPQKLRDFAFTSFKSITSAEKAIKKLDKTKYKEKILILELLDNIKLD